MLWFDDVALCSRYHRACGSWQVHCREGHLWSAGRRGVLEGEGWVRACRHGLHINMGGGGGGMEISGWLFDKNPCMCKISDSKSPPEVVQVWTLGIFGQPTYKFL